MYNTQGTLNQLTLIGRLGQDPEVRYTPKGTAVMKMSVATQARIPREGQWETVTTWHRVVIYGRNAEYWAIRLKKGMAIQTSGALLNREYTDEKGILHKWMELRANDLQCLSKYSAAEEDVPPPEQEQAQE